MKVFFNKETNEVVAGHSLCLFVMDDEVYQDNDDTYESQQKVISFQDFVVHRPDIGWRVE